MKAEQDKDQFISQIINWVVTDARPNIEQISTFDYENKLLWARFEELVVVNGLLCLAEKSEMASISKIIPPKHLRQARLSKYHQGIGRGHIGFKTTYHTQRTILLAAHEGRSKTSFYKLYPLWC